MAHRYSSVRGRERALQHIREGEQLSRELGGTDKDVKEYFYDLSTLELDTILEEYGRLHGVKPLAYARKTLPKWRAGTRKMSGLVAGRLFALLPNRMALDKKYELVKNLWESKCPSSSVRFYIGPDVKSDEVYTLIRDHLNSVVEEYAIPLEIVNRFKWLAQEDVELQQQLNNYFLQLTKDAISAALNQRIPALLRSLNRSDGTVSQITQEISIANHVIVLHFNAQVTGISDTPPNYQNRSWSSSDVGCLIMIILFVLFMFYGLFAP